MSSIAFFVHYNKGNGISRHTLYALKNVRNLYDKVVIISNSKINKNNSKILRKYCDRVILRENIGYDFAAWRDGMRTIGWKNLASYDTLTLLNDTCFFPVFPIDKIIIKFNSNKNVDFWGASIHGSTDTGMPGSNGPVPEHIQSYFMVFKNRVIVSPKFQKFWDEVKDLAEVNDVINKYETRLTPELKDYGFKYDAIYNPNNYNDRNIIDAIYQIPETLIKRHFPFLKLKVINPGNIDIIRTELRLNNSSYPLEYIKSYEITPKNSPIRYYRVFNRIIRKILYQLIKNKY